MFDQYDYGQYGTTIAAPKYERNKEPMPSREELLARNSFGGPDNNPYLRQQQLIRQKEKELAQLKRSAL